MNTPICDFVNRYKNSNSVRLHMPGHKGKKLLGFEELDITEIDGADSLFEADGIIRESEENASCLFGADTFYSAEGSSLSIRAMLYLACAYAKEHGRKPVIAAGRNAHKAFVNAAALLDFDVEWIFGESSMSYLCCDIKPDRLDKVLSGMPDAPCAVYITSPDYLGNMADIEGISDVCRKHGCLCLVDNAHGAYLKFLEKSQHPIDLGADLCCDSAHKTLPVLTGGAYLHISKSAPVFFKDNAKAAMALFGSTSPSYLILQSLDMANRYLDDGYAGKLAGFVSKVYDLKCRLERSGFCFAGSEPLKLTLSTKSCGYKGFEFAGELSKRGVVCEFADPDFAVLMLTPEIGSNELDVLKKAVCEIPKKTAVSEKIPKIPAPERVMRVRDAMFSAKEVLPVEKCQGRILCDAAVSCPPAVPVVVCGEKIDAEAIECFKYYGVKECAVVKTAGI